MIADFIQNNWELIGSVAGGIIFIANAIAKATPNETDNKYVAVAQKVVDFVAMSTGKTKLKDNKLDV